MSPWNFTPQPFGLAQSPSSVAAMTSSKGDNNLVPVNMPIVERLFLDNKKEIEFLGPVNTEVVSIP